VTGWRDTSAAGEGTTAGGHAGTAARRWSAPAVLCCGAALVALAGGPASRAQEIAPFRITGVDGYFLVGGLWDDHSTRQARSGDTAASESGDTQATLREEVFVMTHGYVYHPALLAFDLGGGPVYDSGWYRTEGQTNNSNQWLYNFVARANFLAGKPYQGGLFYEHLNPTQSVGPAEIMLTESESYGMNLALLSPLTPVPMRADARRTTSSGSSPLQVIDERFDELNVDLSAAIGKSGNSRASYTGVRGESRSGSKSLPIVPTDQSHDDFDLDTRLEFGERKQYELINTIGYYDQETRTSEDQFFRSKNGFFDLNLRGRPSDELQTYARYRTQNDEFTSPAEPGSADPELEQTTRTRAASGGLTFRGGEGLAGSIDVSAAWSDGTDVDSTGNSLEGRLDYERTLPVGRLAVNYGLAIAERSQDSRLPFGQVVGERIVLAGTARVPLSRPLVQPGSVVVSNVDRTQTYVENLDYVLTLIGQTTEIQRTVGSNILDGQEVLVDYRFDTGGTYKIDDIRNTANLSWNFGSRLSVWVNYYDTSPQLISGTPTFELNPTTNWSYGTSVNLPVPGTGGQWLVGGSASYTDTQQVVAPGTSSSFDLYTEFPLPWRYGAGLHLGMRRTRARYDLEPEADLDTTAYDLRLWALMPGNVQVSLDGTHQSDTGPQSDRTYDFVSAHASWQYRRVSVRGEVRYNLDSQHGTEDERTVASIGLRRDF